VTIAVAAISCAAGPQRLSAASPEAGKTVVYTASGTFAATQISGNDTLDLRGQPFTITITGTTSLAPSQHGQNWGIFVPLQMTGTIYSGLVPNTPLPITATNAAIDQTVGPSEDIFQAGFPVSEFGIAVNVRAYFTLPAGTLTNPLLQPFASVTLSPIDTVEYFDATATTVLAVESGTLVSVTQ
jgi:hypothetical protein